MNARASRCPAPMRFTRLLPALLMLAAAGTGWAADLAVRVLDQDGAPIADAVVFVPRPAALQKPGQHKRATVAQRHRVFDPFVTVVEKGAAIEFPNEDTMLHHVYSFSRAKRFELKPYKGAAPAPVEFDTAGIVTLGCNLHDWMVAYIVVVDTPLFGKTGRDGTAQIANVPAGVHDLMAWHPGMREPVLARQVDLRSRESQRVEVRLTVPGKTRPRAPPHDPMRY